MPRLILSSTSPQRKVLLERLQLPFEIVAPQVDEAPLLGESAEQLVIRLAMAKAHAVAKKFPNSLIIGCDEVSDFKGEIIGKPGDHITAVQQLLTFSGQTVRFVTGLCLLNSHTTNCQTIIEPFEVTFRHLTKADIEVYLSLEQPYQCAGSLKAEGLGIVMLAAMQGSDPAALLGLPLIKLVDMLAFEGVSPFYRS